MQRCWQELNIAQNHRQQTKLGIFMEHQLCVGLGVGPVIWGNFCHQEGPIALWGFE